jgi:NADPH:quinone reductase-like Zn-dependent oxidoreductase
MLLFLQFQWGVSVKPKKSLPRSLNLLNHFRRKEADMEYMQAAVLTAFGGAEVFEFQNILKPVPKATQVLVRVYATSIDPIDYKHENYIEVIGRETNGRGVDLVLDTVGGDTIARSSEVIHPFGKLVTIVDIATPQTLFDAWGKNLTIHFVLSPQYSDKLDALRNLIERDQIRPVIDSVLPWSDIVQAHQRSEKGGMRGKIVLQLVDGGLTVNRSINKSNRDRFLK